MANPNGAKALNEAYEKGYSSFLIVEKNDKGFYYNPPNPYMKNTLYNKEFTRGFNKAYFDNLKGVNNARSA